MSITKDEYLYVVSGSLMLLMALLFKKYFTLDPIDAGLIINEQAMNLTSQYTDEVREQVTTTKFFEEVRSLDRNAHIYGGILQHKGTNQTHKSFREYNIVGG
jgi:hypothetical protein